MKRTYKSILALFCILTIFMSVAPLADARVSVKGYYRKDGTYVRPHYRSDPDGITTNNWSYCGNINPYTGAVGSSGCNSTSGNGTSSLNSITNNPLTGTLVIDKASISENYFTIGSTKDEVFKVMGEPKYSSYGSLTYGYSTIYLNTENKVTGWLQSTGTPLKVTVGSKKVDAKPFAKGSTMQQVVDAMGTPTYFALFMFSYGDSSVYFDYNGLVSSWSESNNTPLAVEKVVAKIDAPPFTIGSTEQQVIDAMGSPSSKTTYAYNYGKSTVYFDYKGLVSGWDNKHDKELKVTLGSKVDNAAPIEKGFTLQQVVQAMGTPEKYTSNFLYYGNAWIYLGYDGKVSSWFDYYNELNVKR